VSLDSDSLTPSYDLGVLRLVHDLYNLKHNFIDKSRELGLAGLENHFLHWKRLCCTAKPFPTLETTLLHSKTISYAGNDFATQQNHFLAWKRLCYTAKPFPSLETTLLHSKAIS
jgi:hypothetical protein